MRTLLIAFLLISYQAFGTETYLPTARTDYTQNKAGISTMFDIEHRGVDGCNREDALRIGELMARQKLDVGRQAKMACVVSHHSRKELESTSMFFGGRRCSMSAKVACQIEWLPEHRKAMEGRWASHYQTYKLEYKYGKNEYTCKTTDKSSKCELSSTYENQKNEEDDEDNDFPLKGTAACLRYGCFETRPFKARMKDRILEMFFMDPKGDKEIERVEFWEED